MTGPVKTSEAIPDEEIGRRTSGETGLSDRPPGDRLSTRALAIRCARICDDKKSKGIVILDVSRALVITEYFVIATALNRRHMKGIAEEIRQAAKAEGLSAVSIEGWDRGGWLLM